MDEKSAKEFSHELLRVGDLIEENGNKPLALQLKKCAVLLWGYAPEIPVPATGLEEEIDTTVLRRPLSPSPPPELSSDDDTAEEPSWLQRWIPW